MLILLGHGGMLLPIPAFFGQKAVNTLDRPPVHHRADTQTPTHRHMGQFSISSSLDHMHVFGPEHQEETHTDTRRTCKHHTERTPDALTRIKHITTHWATGVLQVDQLSP